MNGFFSILNTTGSTLLSRPCTTTAELGDEVLQAWPVRVACPEGALPGSTLTSLNGSSGPSADPAVSYHLQLDGVRQQYSDVLNRGPRVAAALGRPAEQIVIERDLANRDDCARLIVINDDVSGPLYRPRRQPADSPLIHGRAQIGVFADGQPAPWQLYNGHGAVHGAAIVERTTGATTLLRTIMAAAEADPAIAASAIDVAVGALATTGRPTATNVDGARTRLRELVELAEYRLHAGCDPLTGWNPLAPTPRADQPLHLLVIDDLLPVINDHRCARLLEHLLRGPAARAGISIVTAAYDASAATFGGAALRRELARVNLAVLRTTNGDTGRFLELRLDLTGLPPRWHTGNSSVGVGYLPRLRNAPFRAYQNA